MSMRFGQNRSNLNRASEKIVFAIYPDLRKFAAVVADLDVDPDDLVQDALVAVLKSTSFDRLDNPLAYMKRVVVNLATSNRRRQARWKALRPKAVSPVDYHDEYPSDVGSLAGLGAVDKAALYLAEVDGYSHHEISEMLAISVPAVSKRLSRARRKLREEMMTDHSVIESMTSEAKV